MLQETFAYLEYLSHFNEVKKPMMPTFSVSAYTDSEYLDSISVIMQDFESVDDFQVTLNYLKGD